MTVEVYGDGENKCSWVAKYFISCWLCMEVQNDNDGDDRRSGKRPPKRGEEGGREQTNHKTPVTRK